MRIEWQGQGTEEVGIDQNSGATIVSIDERYFRPIEVETLLGDPSKAEAQLGWTAKTSFIELVREMAAGDMVLAERDSVVAEKGYMAFPRFE